MSRFSCRSSLIAFSVFVALTLTPISAFAQHGGGGGHSGGGGGGGFHGGGGGGFHGGSGGFHGGAVSGGSARGGFEGRGGGFNGAGRSLSGVGHQGGIGAGRNVASSENHSSNLPRAVSDGQWHSFGNAGPSTRSSEGRTSGSVANSKGSIANSNVLARNTAPDNGWHSFGSTASGRGTVASRDASFHGGPSGNWRGGGWGGGWRGFGCCGFGWGGFGWGWGPAWGFGWNWGLGFGWPYWGGYWGLGWNPWWYGPYAYNPYWYAPLAYDYSYDPNYTINWDDNPPPYRLGESGDHNAASHDSISLNVNPSTLGMGDAWY